MKFCISQRTLLKTISAAGRVAAKAAIIPILTHVRIDATGDRISIRATDLDMEITATGDARVDQGGAVCVPAAAFRDIASKLPEDADVKMELDNNRLSIRAGRSRFHLSTLPADDWPEIAGNDTPHSFSIGAKALARMFAKVMFAVSTEETRFYLNGPYLHAVKDGGETYLRMVATDGHRLSRVDIECPENADTIPGVIVPRKAVAEVDRLLKDAPAEVNVRMSPNFIVFDIGAATITSKLIDGTFPDYARVIPKDCDKRAIVNPAALAQAVARVSTISSEKGRAVKFAFSGGSLALSVTNAEVGDATDEIEATWDGPGEMVAGFNSAYVQDCLAALDGDAVTMSFIDPGSPCLMTSDSDWTTLVVLMPMRV